MTVLPGQLLDPVPIPAIFALLIVILAIAYEVGFRIGRWHIRRTPEEKEGPTEVLVASLLALIAFLLAVTIGMAADRFDTRRELVVEQANAIDTAWLRASDLPDPQKTESQALLQEYLPLWINPGDPVQLAANATRAEEIQDELWSMATELAVASPDSVVLEGYLDSLTSLIEIGETRLTALQSARVPETVLWLLILGATVS